MKRIIVALGLLMILCPTMVLAQQAVAGTETDPLLGTWRLNLERSTYSPGSGPPPGFISVRTYTVRPDGFMVTFGANINPADGTAGFLQSTWKHDGTTYPLWGSNALAEFSATGVIPQGGMAYRSVDAYTTELMPGGIPFDGERSRVVSRDGQTMTDTNRGTNAAGNQVNNVTVWDRVQ